MRAVSLALLASAFRDAWKALAFGWNFFRREWRRMLIVLLPCIVAGTLKDVFATIWLVPIQMNRSGIPDRSIGWLSPTFLQWATAVIGALALFLVIPFYAFVLNRVSGGEAQTCWRTAFAAFKKYAIGFGVVWLVGSMVWPVAYYAYSYSYRLEPNYDQTFRTTLLRLAVLVVHQLALLPNLIPVIFVLFAVQGSLLRTVSTLYGLCRRQYLRVLAMTITISAMTAAGIALSQWPLEAAYQFPRHTPENPLRFVLGSISFVFPSMLGRAALGPFQLFMGPGSFPIDKVVRASLISSDYPEAAPILNYDGPPDSVTWLGTVLMWVGMLAVLFIYVPAMLYWVKKRLEASPTTPAPSAPSVGQGSSPFVMK